MSAPFSQSRNAPKARENKCSGNPPTQPGGFLFGGLPRARRFACAAFASRKPEVSVRQVPGRLRSRKQKDADQQTGCECPQAQCANRDKADDVTQVVLCDIVRSMRHCSRPPAVAASVYGALPSSSDVPKGRLSAVKVPRLTRRSVEMGTARRVPTWHTSGRPSLADRASLIVGRRSPSRELPIKNYTLPT